MKLTLEQISAISNEAETLRKIQNVSYGGSDEHITEDHVTEAAWNYLFSNLHKKVADFRVNNNLDEDDISGQNLFELADETELKWLEAFVTADYKISGELESDWKMNFSQKFDFTPFVN